MPGSSVAAWTPPRPTSVISSAEGTPRAAPQGLPRERPAQTLLQLLWVPTTRALKSEPQLRVASHEPEASLGVRMAPWLAPLKYERWWAFSVRERTGGPRGLAL